MRALNRQPLTVRQYASVSQFKVALRTYFCNTYFKTTSCASTIIYSRIYLFNSNSILIRCVYLYIYLCIYKSNNIVDCI